MVKNKKKFAKRKDKQNKDYRKENNNNSKKQKISTQTRYKMENKRKRKIRYIKLSVISPFDFNRNNHFYYEIKNINFFYRYTKDLNKYKPTVEEIDILNEAIKDIRKVTINSEKSMIEVTPYFFSMISNLTKTPLIQDKIDINLNAIIDKYNRNHTISLNKLSQLYLQKTGESLSKTTINRRLRNNLGYSYKKITLKPKDLENKNYKMMTFLFIKIIIRVLSLQLKPIFIDESKIVLKNENFKTWVNNSDFFHYGYKRNEKRNIILAVGTESVFIHKITKLNTNKKIFENFMIELIESIIKKDVIENYVFIMDNLRVHLTKEIKNLVNRYNIKILYTVPYESVYNPIELSFRFIKNKIYRHIYPNIQVLEKEVENIISSSEFENSLKKNWAETLEKYIVFINNNIDVNLNINNITK